MPSKLIGLTRKLEWREFIGTPTPKELAELRQVAATAPDKTVGFAGIRSSFTVTGSTITDDIVVTVNFDGGWKQLGGLSARGEQFLLDHEQGHYDFTALMARDCFIDLMQLKAKTFPKTEQDGIVADYKRKLAAIQKKYDDDTNHGAWVTPSFLPERKESFQTKWEGFIERARTQERTPQVTAPDAATYKVPLLKVLDDGGFVFK